MKIATEMWIASHCVCSLGRNVGLGPAWYLGVLGGSVSLGLCLGLYCEL